MGAERASRPTSPPTGGGCSEGAHSDAADAGVVEAAAGSFDRVLLDAPCSGAGALRRRPEARWRKTASDLGGLVELQQRLLGAAARLVRPGGVIAYVTCSPLVDETVGVVEEIVASAELGLSPLPVTPHVPEALGGLA